MRVQRRTLSAVTEGLGKSAEKREVFTCWKVTIQTSSDLVASAETPIRIFAPLRTWEFMSDHIGHFQTTDERASLFSRTVSPVL